MKTFLHLVTSILLLLPVVASAQPKKLKVFILAGQANMEGPANVSTFDYLGDDPATAPMPKETRELWDKHPQGAHGIPKAEDRPQWHAGKAAATGVYYRLLTEHVVKSRPLIS